MKSDKPKRTKRLTPKQDKFVQEYAKNGGNGTKAALVAYDTVDENTAHVIASENIQKPTIRRELDLAMRDVGLTTKRALGVVSDAMDVMKKMGKRTTISVCVVPT